MGNICSRSSNETDPFSQPGRVLGSSATTNNRTAGAAAPRASLPSNAKTKANNWQSPGRTLGGQTQVGGTSAGAVAAAENSNSNNDVKTIENHEDDARAKAALAAQKRAQNTTPASSSSGGKGKLSTKLAAQKAQTQTQTLNEASRDERAARDSDSAAVARRWE